MTRMTVLPDAFHPQRFGPGLCIIALLAGAGCVSQQTYDRTRAEADELTRTLEAERADLTELDQRIVALQTLNKKEDAAATEWRAAIQRESETGPMLRQRAEDKLAALQTHVAHLVQQSRTLGGEIAEAKQEGASLQALVTQYKQELAEEARSFSSRLTAMPSMPAPAQPLPPAASPVSPITPTAPPQQSAQAAPASSVKPTATSRPAKSGPAQPDDSWTGIIKSWVSSVWEWIFG